MQSESSSCITGVCVLFVYLVFTKGTHHITEVTTVCLKWAGVGARGERRRGESAMPSFGCSDFFFLFFLFWVTNRFLETLQDSFIAVGWFNCSYFLWDFCLFICLSGCAGSQWVRGVSPAPCQASSNLFVAQLGPGPVVGSVSLASLVEFGRRDLALMWQCRHGEGSSHKGDGICCSS